MPHSAYVPPRLRDQLWWSQHAVRILQAVHQLRCAEWCCLFRTCMTSLRLQQCTAKTAAGDAASTTGPNLDRQNLHAVKRSRNQVSKRSPRLYSRLSGFKPCKAPFSNTKLSLTTTAGGFFCSKLLEIAAKSARPHKGVEFSAASPRCFRLEQGSREEPLREHEKSCLTLIIAITCPELSSFLCKEIKSVNLTKSISAGSYHSSPQCTLPATLPLPLNEHN